MNPLTFLQGIEQGFLAVGAFTGAQLLRSAPGLLANGSKSTNTVASSTNSDLATQAQSRNLSGGGAPTNIQVNIGDDQLYDNLHQATEDGRLLVDTRAVVS